MTVPLRREIRKYYGPVWRRKRQYALALRGHHRCGRCGVDHPRINWCHLSGDPRLPGPMDWMCPRCHSAYDAHQRVLVTRRTLSHRHGQLWLSAELQFAHVPFALWPAWAIREVESRNQFLLFEAAA